MSWRVARALDCYGAVKRGCCESWNSCEAGDLCGCVDRWFAGAWYSSGADDYVNTVRGHHDAEPWRGW